VSALGAIGHAVNDYIADRRRLGFQMSCSELRRFARYADGQNHKGPITAELQIAWARMHVRKTSAGTGTQRLQCLRPFVRYYRQYEPSSALLDPTLLGPVRTRPTPHIYTSHELADLIAAAAALEGSDGLRGLAYATFFGLIAATGLRLSEAINLTDADVNLAASQLTVRMTKFSKTRRLPVQRSTVIALSTWRQRRNQRWPSDLDGPFFVGQRGTALKMRNVEWTFEGLRRSLNWKARGAHPQPRIHDMSYPNLHNIPTYDLVC